MQKNEKSNHVVWPAPSPKFLKMAHCPESLATPVLSYFVQPDWHNSTSYKYLVFFYNLPFSLEPNGKQRHLSITNKNIFVPFSWAFTRPGTVSIFCPTVCAIGNTWEKLFQVLTSASVRLAFHAWNGSDGPSPRTARRRSETYGKTTGGKKRHQVIGLVQLVLYELKSVCKKWGRSELELSNTQSEMDAKSNQ